VDIVELRRSTYRFLVGKLEGKRPLGRLGMEFKIILKWMLKK